MHYSVSSRLVTLRLPVLHLPCLRAVMKHFAVLFVRVHSLASCSATLSILGSVAQFLVPTLIGVASSSSSFVEKCESKMFVVFLACQTHSWLELVVFCSPIYPSILLLLELCTQSAIDATHWNPTSNESSAKNNHEPCTCKGRKSVSVGSVCVLGEPWLELLANRFLLLLLLWRKLFWGHVCFVS